MTPAICLAIAIFFEARSEPVIGQIAIGQTIMHRVESKHYPDTVCGVVWQRKQFSFTHDGKSDNPKKYKGYWDRIAWGRAKVLAKRILAGKYEDFTDGANHYHTNRISPKWSLCLRPLQIGSHLFYRL